MINIPCPWCGPRPQTEFAYGGDATKHRPALSDDLNEWLAFAYLRDNPCGDHKELWHHNAGCGQWILVRRDTRTHVVFEGQRLAP